MKHGRTVRASDIAFALLLRIPPAVADPVTTALWEQALDRIASGELALDEFVRQQSRWVSDIVQAHRARTWESAASIAEPLARQRLLRQSFGSEPKGRPPRASRSRRH